MDNGGLLYSIDNGAARIIINREDQRNSISPEVISLFFEYLERAEKDASVRAVMITGAGERAFSSGASLGTGLNNDSKENFKNYAGLLKRLSSFPKPTVARVNGYCLAGGIGLLLACDIAVAMSDAKFGTPEVNVGLWPMMIGALIFRNVSRKKAMRMILLGENIPADEAERIGLITESVPRERLDEAIEKIIAGLVKKSPVGMRIGKEAFYNMDKINFEEALDFLSEKIGEVASTEDAREGITAFLEKREPLFKGR